MDEADGRPAEPVPWRAAEPPPRRRGGSRLRGLLAVLLVVGGSLGASFLVGAVPWPWDPPSDAAPVVERPGSDLGVPAVPAAPSDRPTPGTGASSSPRGVPPRLPAEGGAHAFVLFQADGVTPVAYDPCRVLHYVIRPDGSPAGGEEMVHAAVARIEEVTGLQFVYDGPTDEVPTAEREVFQPDRYGDRWAPVLIAWQTEAENPRLAGDTVGEGGSQAVSLGEGPRVFVTGTVSLDAGQFPAILDSPEGAATASGIVRHELAHLVGLDHVDDASQLLYPETVPGVTDFAAGDLTGLARLGQGVCVPDL